MAFPMGSKPPLMVHCTVLQVLKSQGLGWLAGPSEGYELSASDQLGWLPIPSLPKPNNNQTYCKSKTYKGTAELDDPFF